MAAMLGYVYAHKPFSPEELLGALTAFWRTVIALGILSLAGGIGMLTPIRNWNLPPLTTAMLAAGVGMGALGIFILVIASLFGTGIILWVFFLIFSGGVWKQIFDWWKCFGKQDSFLQGAISGGGLLLIPVLIILICQYLLALAPPFHFDALTYHLALPKFYLLNGRMVYTADNVFWGMPQLVEMLYLLAMSLGGSEAAVVLGWWIGLLALLGLADLIKSINGSKTAWVAIACFLAGSGMTGSLSSGYIEWASIFYGTATLISLYQWLSTDEHSALIISGVFTGLAMSVKYTNGVILISGIAAILILYKPASAALFLKKLVWFLLIPALTLLPWLVKNALATQNPFYPLFLPSGGMDASLLDFYQFQPATRDWSLLILLPIKATVWGVDGSEGFSSSIGPLFLGLSPFAWLSWNEQSAGQRSLTKLSSVILAAGFIIWALGSQFRGLLIQTRLYFILFPAWAILASAGYMNLWNLKTSSISIRFGNIANVVILLFLSFNAFSSLSINTFSNPLSAILNHENPDSYIKRHLGGYTVIMQDIKALPANTKIIMLWETRSLLCTPKCDPDEIIGRWYHDWNMYHAPDQIINTWKNQGYTHVLINQISADFVKEYDEHWFSKESWEDLNATLAKLTPVEVSTEDYKLYQLR